MKIQASFVKDGKWWVAWTDDVPCALTQGATLLCPLKAGTELT
jgi:hypothetical protein